MANTDLGELFLNFVLHELLQELAGVDVTHYQDGSEEGIVAQWERWVLCAMGLKPSPYQTTQAMLIAEYVIRGDPGAGGNVFKWNQAGDENYDPGSPWVYKVKGDGTPAANFCFHVDNN